MTELFLRKATFAVGRPGAAAAVFDGFRITFEIDKTSESSPNPAKISIYNLSKSSRAAFEQGQACILSAGYLGIGGGDPIVSQIYAGDVRWIWTERHGPDLVTTIEAGDAEVALRGVTIEQAFGPGTTVAQMIKSMAGKLNLSVGTIVPAIKGVFQHGVSISGLVSDQLDDLTAKAGLEWHVTDGEINVLDPSVPLPGAAIVVNSATGLISFPSKNKQSIVHFKSLLNPHIRPGRAVLLTSDTYNGLVRCRLCKFRGDTHGGDFSVEVEAYPIG